MECLCAGAMAGFFLGGGVDCCVSAFNISNASFIIIFSSFLKRHQRICGFLYSSCIVCYMNRVILFCSLHFKATVVGSAILTIYTSLYDFYSMIERLIAKY